MRFEITGPAFCGVDDEILLPEGLWNGMVFQAVRTGPGRIEIREKSSRGEPWYLATKGDAPDVIRVAIADLVWTEVCEADPARPLLYLWEVQRDGTPLYRYVGKAQNASRPRTHYRRNIRRLLTGQPYRKGAPEGFRVVHRQLARASREGLSITLRLFENVAPEVDIYEAERAAQARWEVERFAWPVTP